MSQIINSSINGKVFKCSKCKEIHIEYKNLNFNFSEKEYNHFVDYILNIDGSEWETKNQNSGFRRKIVMPINHKNFRILLSAEELQELKNLLSGKERKSNLYLVKDFELMENYIASNLN